MNNSVRFPLRFFLIHVIWSWILWTPLSWGSHKIIPVSDNLVSILTFPAVVLGAFGPLAGALFVLHQEKGNGSIRKYLQSFLDFKLGLEGLCYSCINFWRRSTFIAWFVPELVGEERLSMLLPSIWVYFPCLLFMIFLGGGQEEFGWRGYALPILENKFGIWIFRKHSFRDHLGFLAYAIMVHNRYQSDLYEFRRVYSPDGRILFHSILD